MGQVFSRSFTYICHGHHRRNITTLTPVTLANRKQIEWCKNYQNRCTRLTSSVLQRNKHTYIHPFTYRSINTFLFLCVTQRILRPQNQENSNLWYRQGKWRIKKGQERNTKQYIQSIWPKKVEMLVGFKACHRQETLSSSVDVVFCHDIWSTFFLSIC